MIKSFRDRETRAVFEEEDTKGARRRLPTQLWKKARAKLDQIDAANEPGHLATPSNRLHSLAGSRKGQYAIWINRQYRICFERRQGDAWNVEITDYH